MRPKDLFHWLVTWLGEPQGLSLLLLINVIGTIYGYIWYGAQLASTEPWYLLPFVPDSPTASLFFCVTLIFFLLGRRWALMEALAAVTLFKYGIWATVMIVWTGLEGGPLYWQHYMLIGSHLGMALQALLFIRYFHFKLIHLGAVAIWTLSNDFLDYHLYIFPWLDSRLHPYLSYIYQFTFSLSIFSLLLFYVTVTHRLKGRKVF